MIEENCLPYVVYSHTDYIDVLEIQTDYLSQDKNKVLVINRSQNDELYSKYDQVIFYDDQLPYAGRLLSLSSLTSEYMIYFHDMDIIIDKNNEIIEHIYNFMKNNDINRVDLQYDVYNKSSEIIKFLDFNLTKQVDPSCYIFNLNPSLWKTSSFLEIMLNFRNETYRTIECNVQSYCTKYKVYKILTDIYAKCGYYKCVPFFKFLHITHGGIYSPLLTESSFDRGYDNFSINQYTKIVEKYRLNESKRGMSQSW